ncbi:heavy-metal-associated domain-containing protein [Candidatus Margulisiibacteriota bacterium]
MFLRQKKYYFIGIFISVLFISVFVFNSVNYAFFRTARSGKSVSRQESLSRIDMSVTGITCGSCYYDIKNTLMEKKGISKVDIDPYKNIVSVFYDKNVIKDQQSIPDSITSMGYPATVVKNYKPQRPSKKVNRTSSVLFRQGCSLPGNSGAGCCGY